MRPCRNDAGHRWEVYTSVNGTPNTVFCPLCRLEFPIMWWVVP